MAKPRAPTILTSPQDAALAFYRAFEAKDVINAFTDLERQLASPGGDTRNPPPARPVTPRRPGSLSGPPGCRFPPSSLVGRW